MLISNASNNNKEIASNAGHGLGHQIMNKIRGDKEEEKQKSRVPLDSKKIKEILILSENLQAQ